MEPAARPPGSELISRVHDVCKLHWRSGPVPDAEIVEVETGGLRFLKVSYTRGPWAKHDLVGVHEGQISVAALGRFAALRGQLRTHSVMQIVYTGEPPPADVLELAEQREIWLRTFDEYIGALWDHSDYVRKQTEALAADSEYPLSLHVDKRWAPLGGNVPEQSTVVPHILERLAADGPRFVLVLGDFGTGKTFLLHKIAHELGSRDGLVPVLVTMRDLEKGRTLDELLVQHMARAGVDPFHSTAFRHLLQEGRIALLFDGFDELALRTSYERVPQHFKTLREAAVGAAKVVVTSRHQYFATDRAVRTALGEDVNRLPGSHIIRLFPLEPGQRRTLVVKAFGDDETSADEFLSVLDSVPNLLDLAANPRMLTFMIRWYREGILSAVTLVKSAEDKAMTAGALYELLLQTWLNHEVTRQSADGGLAPMSVPQRMDALRETAMRMWRTGQRSIMLEDLGEVADCIAELARLEMRRAEATQTVGSGTVLVRSGEDEFVFIHQSVMEWFVADAARLAMNTGGPDAVDRLLADNELTAPMADFLCDLVGDDRVVDWARDVVERPQAPGPAAKANASLVLQRRGAQAGRVNYAGQDLRGRDLSGQNLFQADLAGADLSGAVLPTVLREANLSGAKLVGAKLAGADLTGANLHGADLRQAHLAGAVLTGANLAGARLERAVLIGARLDPGALEGARVVGAALPGMEVVPQLAGGSAVRCATLLVEGVVVTGHEDGCLRLHDIVAFRTLRTIAAHDGRVIDVAAGLGGGSLLSVGADGTVLRWDTTNWTSEPVVTGVAGGERYLAVSRSRIAVLTGDGIVVRSASGRDLHTLGAGLEVTSLALDVTGRWLAFAESNGIVHLWNVWTGKKQAVHTGYLGRVLELSVDRTGKRVLARGGSGTRAWGMTRPHVDRAMSNVAFSKRWWALAGSRDKIVESDSGQRTLDDPFPQCTALLADRSGNWLLSGYYRGEIAVQDPASGRLIGRIPIPRASVEAIGVDPLGEWLVASGLDKLPAVWDLVGGGPPTALGEGTFAIAIDPATRLVVTDDVIDGIRVWKVGTGTENHETGRVKLYGGMPSFAVNPSGGRLFFASSESPLVTVVELSIRGISREYEVSQKGTYALALDPRERWFATGNYDEPLQLTALADPPWYKFTRRKTALGEAVGLSCLLFHPDGRWLAAGGLRHVEIWDPEARTLLKKVECGPSWVRSLAVDPKGNWLAACSRDGRLRVWDTETWELRHSTRADSRTLNALAVSPDGSWLASGGDDGVLRLWDPLTGDLKATMVSSANGWAILLPDGRYKVGGKPDDVWWSAGLCRFDAADLDDLAPYLPNMRRMSEEEPLGLGE